MLEAFNGIRIGFCDDFLQNGLCFLLCITGDDKSGVLPLVKYQSDTRAAISRAARELPPWKISGKGERGFGFRA